MDHLSKVYAGLIEHCFHEANGREARLHFRRMPTVQGASHGGGGSFSMMPNIDLNPNYTFEEFVVGSNSQFAYSAAQAGDRRVPEELGDCDEDHGSCQDEAHGCRECTSDVTRARYPRRAIGRVKGQIQAIERTQPAVPKMSAAQAAMANSRQADWVIAVPPTWPTRPPYEAQPSAAAPP